jgi:ATP-dependent Clp protease ATP-binding subunit ClpX
LFELDGVTLEFSQDALKAVSEEALKRNTGARGLRSILEEVMLDVMYDIPSREDIAKCTVTGETIKKKEPPHIIAMDRKKKKEESA